MTVVECRTVAMMKYRVVGVREGEGPVWRGMTETREWAWLDQRSTARQSE